MLSAARFLWLVFHSLQLVYPLSVYILLDKLLESLSFSIASVLEAEPNNYLPAS